jgi:hypothetical protein
MRSGKITNKGGGFVLFISIIIPSAFFALAISIDHGRVILANRVAADIADTLALAAAGARVYDGDKFDLPRSREYAKNTIDMIRIQKVIPNNIYINFEDSKDLKFSPDNTILFVTINWQVDSLPFIDIITGSKNKLITGYVTRSAKICVSDISKTPCAYPL